MVFQTSKPGHGESYPVRELEPGENGYQKHLPEQALNPIPLNTRQK